jgi:serine/threonine protein kinase
MLGKIVNKFRVDAVLGEGGMGIVYRAWDMVLERTVALKMIHRRHTPNEISFRRFLAEAQILAKLEHPNIVQVYDLLEHEESWFIVMQYVEGMTLANVIEREAPMPYRRVSPICKQILAALSYAHRAGVIHRDIKPGNVILAREGAVKVADFGLAKYQHHPALTASTGTAGTLYYMSPEQVKNLANVDPRSDLYATGMTMYEMLTGRTPFLPASPPVDIMNAILEQQFPSPSRLFSSVPEPLSKIVMKALAKAPAQRHQNADEMLKALVQFEHQLARTTTVKLPPGEFGDFADYDLDLQAAQDKGGRSPARSAPSATWQRAGKIKRLGFGALGVAAAVLLILLAPGVWQRAPETPAPPPVARLSILTEPSNATVFLNGDSIGRTPVMAYAAKPGRLALRIEKPDYLPIESLTAVNPGKDTTFHFLLAASKVDTPKTLIAEDDTPKEALSQPPVPPRAVGAVRIDSRPQGATIIFDGQTWGITPRTVRELAVGSHSMVLKKTGYRDASLPVTITGGETQQIHATLLPLMGRLRVLVKPSGAIFIEGVRERLTASGPFETSLPVGSYRIRTDSPQLGFLEKTITIEEDRLHEWTIDFKKKHNEDIIE